MKFLKENWYKLMTGTAMLIFACGFFIYVVSPSYASYIGNSPSNNDYALVPVNKDGMKKQVDYVVIRTVHPSHSKVNIVNAGFLPVYYGDFVPTIKKFMTEGWVCLGGFPKPSQKFTGYHQVMVKYED